MSKTFFQNQNFHSRLFQKKNIEKYFGQKNNKKTKIKKFQLNKIREQKKSNRIKKNKKNYTRINKNKIIFYKFFLQFFVKIVEENKIKTKFQCCLCRKICENILIKI